MGCYDTFIMGETHIQIKCFGGNLKNYHVGDKVPLLHFYEGYREWDKEEQIDTYTVTLPNYEPYKFALFKNRTFIRFTNEVKETYPPYVSKWGEKESYDTSISSKKMGDE